MLQIWKNSEKIGRYGSARLNYIKKCKRNLYDELLMIGELTKNLIEIDKTVNKRISEIIKYMNNVIIIY